MFIQRFGAAPNHRLSFEGLTTEAVMKKYVFEATKESKLSFCELLQSEGDSDSVGTAEVFYSHAWKYLFLDVVDAAKLHFAGSDKDPIIWFDVFSVSQHKAETRPFEWWNSAFLNAIGAIGKVLMLIQPFESTVLATGENLPAWTTLTRVWCVFELYACESTMSQFEVTMTKEISSKFLENLVSNTDLLDKLLSLDCENSTSFKPEDKERVFEVIQRTIGFSALNSMILRVMERWIYSALMSKIKSEDAVRHQCFKVMKSLCQQGLEQRVLKLGREHSDTIGSRRILACFCKAEESEHDFESLISNGIDAEKARIEAEEKARSEAEEKARSEDPSILRCRCHDKCTVA
jgi:hypothetical protein